MSLVSWISWKGTRCEWSTPDEELASELALALSHAGMSVEVSALPEMRDLTAPGEVAEDVWTAEDYIRNAG
jgi:hypothetical protein